jgi:hypothetical protein
MSIACAMTDDELNFKVMKIAARDEMSGGDADRAAGIARKLWEFWNPNPEAPASSGTRGA